MNSKKLAESTMIKAAYQGLKRQSSDGAMPAGHNGSRWHAETIVRNTAHWSITFFTAYRLTGNSDFFLAGKKCIDQIMLPKWRPHKLTFFMRDEQGKDKCNGLIGQAWALESLIFATDYYIEKKSTIQKVIEEVLSSLQFDSGKKLWKITEVTGSVKQCNTFNQELWLALIIIESSQICMNEQLLSNVKIFTNEINKETNWLINHDQVIGHWLKPTANNLGLTAYLIATVIAVGGWLEEKSTRLLLALPLYKDFKYQSLGYNAFNLFALAAIIEKHPDYLSHYLKIRVSQLVRHFSNSEYINTFPNTGYGYNYNPIGFEMAYTEKAIGSNEKEVIMWLKRQLSNYFEEDMTPKNTDDPEVLLARVYELYRLIG